MTKRLRKGLLAFFLVLLLACMAAVTALLAPKPAFADEDGIDTTVVDEIKTVEYKPETNPVATYYLGRGGISGTSTFYYTQFSTGWAEAVNKAAEEYKNNAYVKVVLSGDWIASANADNNTSFGTTPSGYKACFDAGRIYVPSGVNIVLDLNGRKIDRGLYGIAEKADGTTEVIAKPTANGHVMYIQGNLTIIDGSSDQTGLITGAYNNAGTVYGGAIHVVYGTASLNLYGGSIEGNTASGTHIIGAGVCVQGGGVDNAPTFNMYGGRIANNSATITTTYSKPTVWGGGVTVVQYANFNMYGGVIEHNTASVGGGVLSYSVFSSTKENPDILIDGGVIRNNKAVQGVCTNATLVGAGFGGGGIGIYANGNVSVKSGAITGNIAEEYGGAIYAFSTSSTKAPADNDKTTDKLSITISGTAKIHHNVVASVDHDVHGAALAMRRSNTSYYAGTITVENGLIYNNYAIGNNVTTYKVNKDGEYVDSTGAVTEDSKKYVSTYSSMGGGIYGFSCTVTMENGQIYNNKASSIYDAFIEEDDLYDICEKHTAGEDISDYVIDGRRTYGGAVYVYNQRKEDQLGAFIMNDGKLYGNRAMSGGAVANQGDFVMNNGSITGNYGEYGGIYVMALSTITLSGNAKIEDNYSIYLYDSDGDGVGDQKVASNLDIAAADERRIQFTGEFEEGASIHAFVTEDLIKKGQAFTQNYGEFNRKFVPYNGLDEEPVFVDSDENDKEGNPIQVLANGVWVYANPYRYFASDTVFSVEGTKVILDKTVPQNFMVLSGTVTATKHVYNAETDKYDEETYSISVEGELGVARDTITFRVTYSNGDTKDIEFGNVPLTEDNMWNYLQCTYDNDVYPTKITALVNNKIVKEEDVGKDVGIYTLTATPKDPDNTTDTIATTASFHVVIVPKEMDTGMDNLSIDISGHDEYHYDGNAKTPAVNSVTYKFSDNGQLVTLVKADSAEAEGDYWVSYDKNINAGDNTAEVIIHFKGNYIGTAVENFTIFSSLSENITTSVSWEVYNGSAWVPYESNKDIFTFTGSDLSKNIRAKLSAASIADQTVYVEDYIASGDTLQNSSMHIVFLQNEEEVEFKNAGTYSIYVYGTTFTNYPIAEAGRTLDGVVIARKTIEVSKADFDSYVDDNGVRLWTLLIDSNGVLSTSTLLDNATYIDPVNGTDNGYGVKVAVGDTPDSYARFRAAALSLELNENYTLANGMTLLELLSYEGEVSVAEWVSGELNKVKEVTTSITITFGDNYIVGEDNTITLEKSWKIVTMTNDLLKANDGTAVEGKELQGWTYANLDVLETLVDSHIFRPEHGDTVIYSYYLSGSDAAPKQFAIVYSDDTASAVRRVYAVKSDSNGDFVVDLENMLGDESYLYTFSYELIAGDYTVEVKVPQPVVSDGHRHWFDGDSVGDDNGVMYYEFNYEFTLTIEGFEMAEESVKGDTPVVEEGPITITFPDAIDNYVYYTGEEDNIVPNITITLYGKTLVEGVDYTLSSVSTEAGEAVLTIVGSGVNLRGTYTIRNAYVIRQAINGWEDLPSISNWTYKAFDRRISLISGTPDFGSDNIWFAIASDKDGNNVIPGLERIVLENGYVPTGVEGILQNLDAGFYYLFAYVEDTKNYSALENSVEFRVFTATNSWSVTPTVNTWIEGRYDEIEYDEDGNEVQRIVVNPVFGSAHIHIEDDYGNVFYDSDEEIDLLNDAKPGRYFLMAWVDADKAGTGADATLINYTGLDIYTLIFYVFEAPGLPWWGTLLIAVGSLALAALIIFILWKKGVFQIVTDKILLKIRTRVSVESTIASVRAAKRMEEGRKSVEEAKRRERLEQARERQRNMTPEERAAQMEAKAQANAARAERLRARSEADLAKVEKMRQANAAAEAEVENESEVASTDSETPTEE